MYALYYFIPRGGWFLAERGYEYDRLGKKAARLGRQGYQTRLEWSE